VTTNNPGHPTTFVLDVYWASGCVPDGSVERHLLDCPRCQGYLGGLEALRRVARSAPPPAPASPVRRFRLPGGPRRNVWPALAAIAVAAALVVVFRATRVTTGNYVESKGAPAVQVLVRRGGTTRIWDGRTPMHPGDALALRVACEGLPHVAVASPAEREWRRLSDVACPGPGDPLPFTLIVDDQPGDEKLALVLSQTEINDTRLRRAIAEAQQTKDVWVVHLVLPKEIGR
jgi:hypothetical protein